MSKDAIKPLLNLFRAVNEDTEVTVESCVELEYFYEIIIANASVSERRNSAITQFFGGRVNSIEPVAESQGLRVRVSKVDLPSYYDVMKVIPYLEQAEAQSKGLFVGIGEFGPVHVDFDDLRHFMICGSSGTGKSRFARQLIAQNSAFQNGIVNHIIDPKNIDFQAYEGLPGIGKIARDKDAWNSLLAAIVVEQGIRETVFSGAFECPPTTLTEYHAARTSFKRHDLPEFPRMIVWIDEAHMLMSKVNDQPYSFFFLSMLARKGRAVGIHLGFISQRISDIYTGIQSQCATQFLFDLNESHMASWLSSDMTALVQDKTSGSPGRLVVKSANWDVPVVAQAPDCSADDALAMGRGYGCSVVANGGFTRLALDPKVIMGGSLAGLLLGGTSLKTALSTLHDLLAMNPLARLPVALPQQSLSYDVPAEYLAFYDLIDSKAELEKISPAPADAQAHTAQPEGKKGLIDGVLHQSVKPWFVRSRNKPSVADSTYRLIAARATTDNQSFSWAVRDLSANEGIEAIRSYLNSPKVSPWATHLQHDLLALGLNEQASSDVARYIQSHQTSQKEHARSRVLALSVDDKVLVRHITGYIAAHCNLPVIETHLAKSGRTPTTNVFGMEGDTGQSKSSAESSDLPDETLYFSVSFANRKSFKATGVGLLLTDNAVRAESLANSLRVGSIVICYGRSQAADISLSSTPSMLVKIPEDDFISRSQNLTLLAQVEIRRAILLLGLPEEAAIHMAKQDLSPLVAMLNDVPRTARTKTLRRFALKLAHEVDWARSSYGAKAPAMIERIAAEIRASLSSAAAPDSVSVIAPSSRLSDVAFDEEAERGLLETITRAKMALGASKSQFKFMKKLRATPQVVALFHGAPGTGKTLGAEVVASELGTLLWKVDISAVQSKYVGDTEKLFTELFERAAAQRVVLLLDECDAFLGKREEQQSSHARKWVNHLLTLIESHAGVVILTTNFAGSLDAAIGRRCEPRVEFSIPTVSTVENIIRSLLLPDAPLAANFDFAACAKQGLGLSGGYLRNAIERAAMRMLSASQPCLTTQDIIAALQEIRAESGLAGHPLDGHRAIGFEGAA